MKIMMAVDSNKGMDSKIDTRFGRAAYFLIYNTQANEIVSIEANPYKDAAQGVGIKSATYVVENGCLAAIGAQPGPKAAAILSDAEIKMVVAESRTVNETVKLYCSQTGIKPEYDPDVTVSGRK